MAFDLGAALKNVSRVDTGKEQITYLPIDNLDSDAGNFYELTGIDALADNISVAGLQQPIRVRAGQEPGRYTIVSGHRRMAACRKLAEENPEAWREAPCIIETDDASPALQQLRLIYANANTRQLTSAEMSEQAQQVEKLLYELKEEGYDFPGRMRDHVAEAVGASKTKLARLKVIRDKLIPEWTAFWKNNKLPESTAYVLAQADPEYQRRILDNEVRVYGGYDFPIPGLPTVENRLKEMAKSDKLVSGLGCPIRSKSKCLHRAPRLQRAAHCGTYDALCCAGCCRKCSNLAYCTFSCELAGDLKKEQRSKITAENAAKKAAEKAAENARIFSAKEALAKSYSRVRDLREKRGVSEEAFVKASLGFAYDRNVERVKALEQGHPNGNDRMPGGIWPDDARHLVNTAELLGCSVDYLLGRDAPEVTAPGGIWHTGEPSKTGDYIAIYDFDRDSKALIDKMHWDKYDRLWTIAHASLPDGVTVHLWTEVPDVKIKD
nr:MAG TPA: chromosome partitioning protein [Caudoviricetes sp.]